MVISSGAWDPVVVTFVSGVPELSSKDVVKWAPLLVEEGFVLVTSHSVARLVFSSLGVAETFFGCRDVWVDAVTGGTELLGAPLVGEAGGLCGELDQVAVGGICFAGRETGKGTEVGTLCTLNPAVKMQRAKRILQTMVRGS